MTLSFCTWAKTTTRVFNKKRQQQTPDFQHQPVYPIKSLCHHAPSAAFAIVALSNPFFSKQRRLSPTEITHHQAAASKARGRSIPWTPNVLFQIATWSKSGVRQRNNPFKNRLIRHLLGDVCSTGRTHRTQNHQKNRTQQKLFSLSYLKTLLSAQHNPTGRIQPPWKHHEKPDYPSPYPKKEYSWGKPSNSGTQPRLWLKAYGSHINCRRRSLMRQFLTMALEKAGHHVTSCADGLCGFYAIEAIGETIDLLWPTLSCTAWMELSFRKKPQNAPHIKILFITGFSAVAVGKGTEDQTPARVLSKPFHPEWSGGTNHRDRWNTFETKTLE